MSPDIAPILSAEQAELDFPETLQLEARLISRGLRHIAGVDEAGRGCLAGPVVAAAVIFSEGTFVDGVRDSKMINKEERETLALEIKSAARCWAVASCTPAEIDRLNILWASMEAMRRALENLDTCPEHVLIDGNTLIPNAAWPCQAVVKGDSRSHSIAAASILAKTHRDFLLHSLHETHPEYGWNTNVGYPTPAHYEALRLHGPTTHHRQSFRLY